MKKFDFNRIRLRKVNPDELNSRLLLLNLYLTQGFILIIGLIILFFQKQSLWNLFFLESFSVVAVWGITFAAAVLLGDLLISRFVPEELTDDGGLNKLLFEDRPLWHIALISAIVAVCEELLFRGAIQAAWGPYWTSILFAAIHIRYLQHWLLTGMVFAISYGLGWIYIQTGSLWTPIVAHFTIDFVMGCIIRYRREK